MASVIHRIPQTTIAGCDLHHAHGEGHRRFVLPGDMDKIAAQNAVGIEA